MMNPEGAWPTAEFWEVVALLRSASGEGWQPNNAVFTKLVRVVLDGDVWNGQASLTVICDPRAERGPGSFIYISVWAEKESEGTQERLVQSHWYRDFLDKLKDRGYQADWDPRGRPQVFISLFLDSLLAAEQERAILDQLFES